MSMNRCSGCAEKDAKIEEIELMLGVTIACEACRVNWDLNKQFCLPHQFVVGVRG